MLPLTTLCVAIAPVHSKKSIVFSQHSDRCEFNVNLGDKRPDLFQSVVRRVTGCCARENPSPVFGVLGLGPGVHNPLAYEVEGNESLPEDWLVA